MKSKLLNFNNKRIRSSIIYNHIGPERPVVCFSCGNATRELKKAGLNVIDISPNGVLTPNKWFTEKEFYTVFPTMFNATSGYLPMELMNKIALAIRQSVGPLSLNEYDVACGSGETVTCLAMAYPNTIFNAIYNNDKPETKYNDQSPLNILVSLLTNKTVIQSKQEQ